MGAEVTAFTHQEDKVEDCKKMGASEVVVTDKEGKVRFGRTDRG